MGGAAYPERGADSALTDSFIGISKAHTTNLAVAPGIAEAATALGLVAAIPRGHDLEQLGRAIASPLPR